MHPLHKNIFILALLSFWLPIFLLAQSPADTLTRYPGDRFLVKMPDRYELKDNKGLIDWWEEMGSTLTLDTKTYYLVKRKEEGQWKIGLFRRPEGKLYLHPLYKQISTLFGSSRLIVIKGNNGFFAYSMENGNKTREGFQSLRQFGNKDCLGFAENGIFIYNEGLELKDSIPGNCKPAGQLSNGKQEYLFLICDGNNLLVDDQYHRSLHPDWKKIIKLEGNLLLIEGSSGQGVYHLGQNRMLTSFDHQPYLYELHAARFVLFKEGNYILYDSTGKTLTKVRADGLACVEDLLAFFYYQDQLWKIINSEGKVLKTPAFNFFEQSKAPIGQFIARVNGQTKLNRYAWVYETTNGQKKITGIKLLGEYKENDPASKNWPPNQPVEIKQEP